MNVRWSQLVRQAVGKGKRQGSPRDLGRLLSYVKPYRARLAVAVLSLLFAGLLALIMPQLMRFLVDAALVDRNPRKVDAAAILLVGLFAGQALFGFLRSYLLSYMGERIVADIRVQLYAHLMSLSVSFFESRRIGELTSRLSSDVSIIQTVAASTLAEFLRLSVVLIGAIVITAITNLRLTLLMLAVVPLIILIATIYRRHIQYISTMVQDRLAEANSVVEESLSAIRIVQSFVREEYERKRYRRKVKDALQVAVRRSVARAGFNAFAILVGYTGFGFVIWFGNNMVVSGKLTAGELTAFGLYMLVVSGALEEMSECYGQFQSAIGATARVFELLDTEPQIRDAENVRPLEGMRGHVQIKDVHFAYPDDRGLEVLKGVTIDAQPEEIIALVGPSGAGKSTLISLIPRFYDISSGAILVDGHDIKALRLSSLRKAIGIVPQDTVLFGGTIRENIAYSKLDATEQEIEAVARAAHAHEFITNFPAGYNTLVGERGVKLSGGQRQRIAIARALLKNPPILILDEATSSLDSESERLIQDALDRLMQSRTTFVIAHRLSTVQCAKRIIVLDEGMIVEEGTHQDLLLRNGLYKQLYNTQFRAHKLPQINLASGTP